MVRPAPTGWSRAARLRAQAAAGGATGSTPRWSSSGARRLRSSPSSSGGSAAPRSKASSSRPSPGIPTVSGGAPGCATPWTPGAGRGLRRHRSHDVVEIAACPIADPEVDAVGVPTRRWPGVAAVEVIAARAGDEVERLVVVEPTAGIGPAANGRPRLPVLDAPASLARRGPVGVERLRGRGWVREEVLVEGRPRTFRVSGDGFWQVHPGAAQALLDAVLDAAAPRPGERALDLYCGVGLFAAGLAARVGAGGSVLGVEGEARAVADARRNLHDLPWVRWRTPRSRTR